MRGKLSIVEKILRGVRIKSRKLGQLKKKYSMKKMETILPSIKQILIQKVQLKAQRKTARKYKIRTKFYRQNNIFKTEKRSFTGN